MPVVLLDRDGVVNHDSDAFIRSPEQWRALPGSLEAIARLTRAGFRVAVCSNQSGIARGLLDEAELEAIHRKMCAEVEAAGGRIDGIFYCPHGPDAGCDCRKPAPGLLRQAAAALGFDLRGVPFIGDAARDLAAARAAGARPILVRTGKGERTVADGLAPEEVYADLAAAAAALIREREADRGCE
jgi:D-glycero-D-manno-heptose 1,7-bisphosphate phosphatase